MCESCVLSNRGRQGTAYTAQNNRNQETKQEAEMSIDSGFENEDNHEYSGDGKTLDDVMERIMENGKFDSSLQDFLDTMPHTRESTDELLDAVLEWDLWELYNKLLTDHDDLLTPEEREKLKADYRQLFDLPLPGEEDWDDE